MIPSTRKKLLAAAVASLAAAAFVQPAAAERSQEGAAAGAKHASSSTGFRVRASRGYTIYVTGVPDNGQSTAFVELEARTNGKLASYFGSGSITPHHIRGHFGQLGSLDMRFHASGTTRNFKPNCHGHKHKVKEGVWRGTLEFRGEGGYTHASATKAKPTWGYGPSGCEHVSSGPGAKGAYLTSARKRIQFDAYQNQGPGTATQFRASEYELGSNVPVRREVWATGSPNAFTYNESLARAKVKPPGPFAGGARFRAHGDQGDGVVKGSLEARFPGGRTLPLFKHKQDASIQYAKVRIVHY